MRAGLVPVLFGPLGWVLHGASLDMDFANGRAWLKGSGTRTLSDLLTCSRASSGFAPNSAGLLVPFVSNQMRITNQGILAEESRTNVVLWNRDLTNAAWTASNVTVAKNQTGADGVANAASSLTATGINGTVLQAITLVSSARFQSAYVKRLSGTGTINMTMDNGSTWTAIVPTAAWTQLTIPTQTLANPTVGFRIVTSGDAIAVDFVQNTNGAFATSPIATTAAAATRAADNVTLNNVSPFTGGAASVLAAIAPMEGVASGNPRVIGAILSGGPAPIAVNTAAQISSWNASVELDAFIGGSNLLTVPGKLACGFNASGRSLVGNNGTVGTDANTFTAAQMAVIHIGSGGNTAWLNGFIQRVTVWSSRLPDSTLKALTV